MRREGELIKCEGCLVSTDKMLLSLMPPASGLILLLVRCNKGTTRTSEEGPDLALLLPVDSDLKMKVLVTVTYVTSLFGNARCRTQASSTNFLEQFIYES